MNQKIEIDKEFFKEKSKKIIKRRKYKTKYFSGTIERTNKRVLEITTTTVFHYTNHSLPNETINKLYLAKIINLINEDFKGWNRIFSAVNYKFCFFLNSDMEIIENYYKIVFINKENKSKIYKLYNNEFNNELFIDYKGNTFIGTSLIKKDLLKTFYNVEIETELLETELILPLIEMQIIS